MGVKLRKIRGKCYLVIDYRGKRKTRVIEVMPRSHKKCGVRLKRGLLSAILEFLNLIKRRRRRSRRTQNAGSSLTHKFSASRQRTAAMNNCFEYTSCPVLAKSACLKSSGSTLRISWPIH